MKSKLAHILVKFLLLIMLIVISNELFSQRVQPNRWIIKADGGISIFFGDVKRYDYIPEFEATGEIQPMFGLNIGKELSRVFSVRGQFIMGKLGGHKQSAHYNFRSDYMGGHVLADFNILNIFNKRARFGKAKFNVFASIGLGYSTWQSVLHYDNPLSDGTDIIAESHDGALSIPGALSMEYSFNRNFSMNMEGMLVVITSDEVDAKVGGISLDMMNYLSLGIVYRFNLNKKVKKSKPIINEKSKVANKKEKEVVVEKTEKKAEVVIPKGVDLPEDDTEVENDTKVIIEKEVEQDTSWNGTIFSVQILASKTPIKAEIIKRNLNIYEKISEKYNGVWYRYSVGKFDNLEDAKKHRNIYREKAGTKNSFIVVYRNGERISLEDALNYAARSQRHSEKVNEVEDKMAEKVYPMVTLDANIPSSGIVIGVQVLSIQNDEYPLGVFSGIYGIDRPIIVAYKNPWYKIIVSGFLNYKDAYDFQFVARDKGFIDAFVIAYKDGKRISIKKLKEELAK
jgi:hypothetical protein